MWELIDYKNTHSPLRAYIIIVIQTFNKHIKVFPQNMELNEKAEGNLASPFVPPTQRLSMLRVN